MQTYIALLRGINVSGKKKIKMADLRNYLSDLSLGDVKTYIQSGNIFFKYEGKDEVVLAQMIHEKIKEKYGFEVPTIVRTPAYVEYVLGNNPFLKHSDKDISRVYFTFLDGVPEEEGVEKLKTVDYSPEEYIIDGKCIYFYSPKGYGRAKMNNNFFEKKLKVGATTRNLKTVKKLLEMGKE